MHVDRYASTGQPPFATQTNLQFDKFTWNTSKSIREQLGNSKVDSYLGSTYLFDYPSFQEHVETSVRSYFRFPSTALHPFNVSDNVSVSLTTARGEPLGPYVLSNKTEFALLWNNVTAELVQQAALIEIVFWFASEQLASNPTGSAFGDISYE